MSEKQLQKIKSYDIAQSSDTIELAQDIARFIKENNLYTNIQGKAYVNCEGWMYAGSRLGILPVVETLEKVSDDPLKYQAKVNLLNIRTGQNIGCGFAICSNTEIGKRGYQEFAIASMAQTRAIGKAYRNLLAWIIRAAGYSPTPAEEAEWETVPEKPKKQAAKKPDPQPDPSLATESEKDQLRSLLNNKLITKDEREAMLDNINSFTSVRCQKAINKIKQTIEDRTPTEDEAASDEQIALIKKLSKSHVFEGDKSVAIILKKVDSGSLTKIEASVDIEYLMDEIKIRKEAEKGVVSNG